MLYTARTRIVYQIVLGIPKAQARHTALEAARDTLDVTLTAITGGVTRFDGTGTWTAGSEQGDFTGPVERDHAITYIVSVMPHEEEAKFGLIKDAIKNAVSQYRLPIQHVHVARSITEERIFRIDAVSQWEAG